MNTLDRLEDFVELSADEVERRFQGGSLPDAEGLVDFEFRGFNLTVITKLLGFQKFRKGFYRHGSEIWGYNVPVEQGPIEAPWRCRPSDDAPKRFGFYRVTPVNPSDETAKVSQSLFLDYSQGKNSLFEGSFLRDYLRAVGGRQDLLLGKAYMSVGGAQLFPAYFVLERDRKAPDGVEHRGR